MEEKIIRQMSFVGILGNTLLTIFKFTAGIVGHSSAMVSDAIHSLSDIIATIVAYIGAKTSKKEADAGHPYGHDRFECVASIILALILIDTGLLLGYKGISAILLSSYSAAPGFLPIIAAIVSIVSKEAMYWYTRHYAKKINSAVFMADAWHHRTDAISSIGALIGIILARNGILWGDAAASILISVFIIYLGVKIFLQSVNKMTDTACPIEFENKIRKILENENVRTDKLTTRKFGEKVYIDIEIALPSEMTLKESHTIAEKIHDEIEKEFSEVKHVMVHVNPII